eukprot:COSAG01_NODE_73036_length_251_cov_0.750000_1_plen_57_part_10
MSVIEGIRALMPSINSYRCVTHLYKCVTQRVVQLDAPLRPPPPSTLSRAAAEGASRH